MALIASLELSTKLYKVCDFTYHASRPHNSFRPDHDARCEHIQITVNVPPKTDHKLYEWFVNGESLSGKILIATSEGAQLSNKKYNKAINFTKALCYNITETYDYATALPRELSLSIVATEVKIEYKDITVTTCPTEPVSFNGLLLCKDLLKEDSQVNSNSLGAYSLKTFHYESHRERSSSGIPLGTTPIAMLDFMINVNKDKFEKCFYDDMTSNEAKTYTFLFDNAKNTGEAKYLYDYDHGIVARGYIVDIEETYDKTVADGKAMLIQLKVRMLLASLKFTKESTTPKERTTLTITDD